MSVKQIFLIDAVGAALSVLIMGAILTALNAWHGMPTYGLVICGLWAAASLAYSAGCRALADLTQPRWLRGIMMANTAYCGLTLCLIMSHLHLLTALGILYFLAEIPVILGLVMWERHVYRAAYGD